MLHNLMIGAAITVAALILAPAAALAFLIVTGNERVFRRRGAHELSGSGWIDENLRAASPHTQAKPQGTGLDVPQRTDARVRHIPE